MSVAEAARRLGCVTSTVRELLEAGELQGHNVGRNRAGKAPRGVRVHVVSIRRYKRRNAIGSKAPANDVASPSRVAHNPAAAEARRRLRELGVL